VCELEKENAAATWKKTFGYHPLLAFLDRPDVSGGEGLAGLLRPGNAGSNTAADHVTVLDLALAALPEEARPRPDDPDSRRVLARSDSAGATHTFAAVCRKRGVRFSFGFPVDERIQRIVDLIPDQCWMPALDSDGEIRDGAWVAEATGLIDLSNWPEGSRLILRKERPHPGAQLSFTDADGHRITALLTDTPPGLVPGQAAGLELRHRQHARVEDRIREGKASGLRNFPCLILSSLFDQGVDLRGCDVDGVVDGAALGPAQHGPMSFEVFFFGVSRAPAGPWAFAARCSPRVRATVSRSCRLSSSSRRMRSVAASRRRSSEASEARCLSGTARVVDGRGWRARSRSISARRSCWP